MSTDASASPAGAGTRIAAQPIYGWLRSPTFDANFIGVSTLVAIGSGCLTVLQPNLFSWILFFDLWLLGYHHVISTFTRLTFDSESFRQHRFLVIQLPLIVLVGTLAAVMTLGYWILPTVYLYWQWFHYVRQSYGIERIYRRKAGEDALIDNYVVTRTLYLVPLFGILYRSYQAQPEFLGTPTKYLPILPEIVLAAGLLAAAGLVLFVITALVDLYQRRIAVAHTLYLLSHHSIFLIGYVAIDDITTGWLVINVWHNIQYIMLVWSFNNMRFKNGIDPKHLLLSTISQTKNYLAYLGVCMALTTIVYFALKKSTLAVGTSTAIPVTLLVFMMINFHHYIVDGIIWKVRKPTLQKNLGIKS